MDPIRWTHRYEQKVHTQITNLTLAKELCQIFCFRTEKVNCQLKCDNDYLLTKFWERNTDTCNKLY